MSDHFDLSHERGISKTSAVHRFAVDSERVCDVAVAGAMGATFEAPREGGRHPFPPTDPKGRW